MLKLTQEQAQQIIDLHVAGKTTTIIAKRFAVSQGNILSILKGKTWKECNRPDNLQCLIGKLNKQQAQEIINLFIAGEDVTVLSHQYNVAESSVYNIISGRTWKKCNRPDDIENKLKHPITQETAQKIINEFCDGASTYELQDKYDLWQTSICNLIAGRSWSQCTRPTNIEDLIEQRRQKGRFELGRVCHIDAPPFTPYQKDIIIGSLLGDGSLRTDCRNSSFSKTQRKDRLAYLKWMENALKPYNNGISPIYSSEKLIGGKNGVILERRKIPRRLSGYTLQTHQHPNWTELQKQWYNSVKIVPLDLQLNPLRIAIWFWDDGSNCTNNRCATFCTQSFTMEEADFLASKLHDFEIFPKVIYVTSTYTGRKMPLLKVYSKSYDNLIALVKPYMLWNCFAYKIQHRKALTNHTRKPISEWKSDPCKLKEKDVLEILDMSRTHSQQKIADKFGVRQTTISAIITGKTWKHLQRG